MFDFPPKIISERFREDFRRVRLRHDDVMFKTVLANVTQDFLQVRHVCDRAVAKRVERIVRQFAFTDVATNFTFSIGGGNAAISQRTGWCAAIPT